MNKYAKRQLPWVLPPGYEQWVAMAVDEARYVMTSPIHTDRRQYGLINTATFLVTEGHPNCPRPGTAPGTKRAPDGSSHKLPRYRSLAALAAPEDEPVIVEHVYQRKHAVDAIMADYTCAERIFRQLATCLVTKAEDRRLDAVGRTNRAAPASFVSAVDGWERYRLAGIDVMDMLTMRPHLADSRCR